MPCDYCGNEVPVVTLFPAALAARPGVRSSGHETDICENCLMAALEALRIMMEAKPLEEWRFPS